VLSSAVMQVMLFPGVMTTTLGFGKLWHQSNWE